MLDDADGSAHAYRTLKVNSGFYSHGSASLNREVDPLVWQSGNCIQRDFSRAYRCRLIYGKRWIAADLFDRIAVYPTTIQATIAPFADP